MAWNVFKLCTRLRCLGSVMILLVLTLVAFTYYTIVLAIYGPALFSGGLRSLTALPVLILFHALLVMLLWSYFAVVFTDPGRVPSNWRPKIDEEIGDVDPLEESSGSPLNVVVGEPDHRRIRYCRKCNQFKPPRCHHCSVCAFSKWTTIAFGL
ncbi:DHHC-type zinc finger family protein isoform 2 [Sesbania bispinosa]|nr:DHHC-type zinc finger family protein isoform 2 [Sesbania bispinosa]